jgi:hypothetical protein
MKCSKSGETTQCAHLNHLADPIGWLDNHLRINNPGPNDHLFTWKHPKYGLRPLTKTEVTKRIHQVVIQHALPEIKGHSFRIGGTLHYLLLGTPFDIVKTMGRWSGESFTKYLRKHALILAPYLIKRPNIIECLTQHAMPPVRLHSSKCLFLHEGVELHFAHLRLLDHWDRSSLAPRGSSALGRKALWAFAQSPPHCTSTPLYMYIPTL